MKSASILVGCPGSVAWVRIDGCANHENAGDIREFLRDRYENGWRRFVIDLKNCTGIDSTFIGMLYRLAADLDEDGEGGVVEVIHPGERNERSIRKLGLDSLIRIDREGSNWTAEKQLVEENLSKPASSEPLDPRERAELVLEAHEALSEANDANRNRFRDVVDFLRKDLGLPSAGG